MKEYYLGIDIGSISTKGVIIDNDNNIITSLYIWTEGNPVSAVKNLIKELKHKMPKEGVIKGIGTTGSARKLIGLMLGANVVKNEITAHAVGTLAYYPDVRTILEIGGQDSKMIIIDNGVVVDYSMNTLCAAGTGSFLTSQSKRLGIPIENFGEMALKSKNPVKIAARCTVFAESDLIHKAQIGYSKEDIIAGLCKSIVLNYLNNVGKGKRIVGPIVFQGGVSKNKGVLKYFEEILKSSVIVDENSHLMGAIGIAILSRKNRTDQKYSLDMNNIDFKTIGSECSLCSNNCEVLKIYKNNELIDTWGNRCPKGSK
ncbi:MAG: acyl-CoA dehydratase activase [Bacilli bacterium]|nr:acyl-CoA dehydratase activase [Bacilli bacterium]MDD4282248.1 acyl-CoA dehydratase activase [Bacilli bacterium]MDD4718628.1 acyl-CoA dehydratase activase [Bacilli bacterium]